MGAGGDKIKHPIPDCAGRETRLDTDAAPGAKLTDADKTILQAVIELSGSPKGAEIAVKAGYPYDAHLKMRLSLLRRRGFLGGAKTETGYPITDTACDAMAEELLQGSALAAVDWREIARHYIDDAKEEAAQTRWTRDSVMADLPQQNPDAGATCAGGSADAREVRRNGEDADERRRKNSR